MHTVCLIEDHPKTAKFVKEALLASNQFQLLSWNTNAEEGLKSIGENEPQICIIDLGLPGMGGIEAVKQVRRFNKETRIMVFTTFEDTDSIIAAIEAGANGYILKDISSSLFAAELTVLAHGGSPMTGAVASTILDNYQGRQKEAESLNITAREEEILNLISLGLTYREIAADLDLSPNTVRSHIDKVYSKLKVNSKTQAINAGRRIGII